MPSRDELPVAPEGEPLAPSSMTAWALRPPITRSDIPALCEQLLALVQSAGTTVVICDVAAFTDPDLVTVETLARLQLTVRRHGHHLTLDRPSVRLRTLLILTGMHLVLMPHPDLVVEPCRQPEQREQPLDVEEVVDPGDPAV